LSNAQDQIQTLRERRPEPGAGVVVVRVRERSLYADAKRLVRNLFGDRRKLREERSVLLKSLARALPCLGHGLTVVFYLHLKAHPESALAHEDGGMMMMLLRSGTSRN